MSWRTTRSATSSNSVGSRLMITSRAPLRLAISGKPAAGQTTSDEPIARKRSQPQRQLLGAPHRGLRHRLAERDRRGLDVAAAGGPRRRAAFRGVETLLDPRQLIARRAIEAGRVGGVAVQFDDVFGSDARGLVQIVDVLRHHAGRLAGPVERSQRTVPAPRLCAAELILHGEAPPPGLVAHLLAGQEIGELDRPHLGPDAAGRAEIRDAAFGRDAGPGERHDDACAGRTARAERPMAVSSRARSCICPGARAAGTSRRPATMRLSP